MTDLAQAVSPINAGTAVFLHMEQFNLAVSTVAITAYKKKNYHPVLCSAITGYLLSLAAALFVDDTDQFHLSRDNQSEDNFISQVQSAITLLGIIVLATDCYLKQSKC